MARLQPRRLLAVWWPWLYPERSEDVSKGAEIKRASQAVEIVSRSTFDPKVLAKLVHGMQAEAELIRETTLDDDDDEVFAGDRLRAFKALAKKIDEVQEQLSREHLDALQKIRNLIKPFKNVVALGLGAYAGLLEEYNVRKAEARRAELKAAQLAAKKRDTKELTRSLGAARESQTQALEGVSLKVVWLVVSADVDELPAKYVTKTPNLAKLQLYADQYRDDETPPPISGVKFKLGTKQRVRT